MEKNHNTRRRLIGAFIVLFLISMAAFIINNMGILKADEPIIENHNILHPTFATNIGQFSAGTFFIAKVEGYDMPLAITALHIFGPKGGLDRQYNTSELKSLIQDVSLVDAFDHSDIKLKLEPMTVNGAAINKKHAIGDIAAFLVKESKDLPYFKFSKSRVKSGDKVWLVTSVIAGAEETKKLHRATVLTVTKNDIRIKYDNQNLVFKGTSGSPVINGKGEVIGINIGANYEDGILIGYSNPAIEVYKMLQNSKRMILE